MAHAPARASRDFPVPRRGFRRGLGGGTPRGGFETASGQGEISSPRPKTPPPRSPTQVSRKRAPPPFVFFPRRPLLGGFSLGRSPLPWKSHPVSKGHLGALKEGPTPTSGRTFLPKNYLTTPPRGGIIDGLGWDWSGNVGDYTHPTPRMSRRKCDFFLENTS